MPHPFGVSIHPTGDERVEIRGEVPDEDWAVLTTFLDRFDRLLQTRVAAGASVTVEMTFEAEKGTSWKTDTPHHDDVDAFIYRMRPFVLQDEPTSFSNVAKIVGRLIPHYAVRATLKKARKVFDGRDFQSRVRMTVNGRLLNGEEALQHWLNGTGEYHGDMDRAEALKPFTGGAPPDAMRALFLSMMLDKAKAVAVLATMVRVLLKRETPGVEVKFGGFDFSRCRGVSSPGDIP